MITLENAIKTLIEHRPTRSMIMQSLDKALGTHCAQDIIARVTLPPFKASAMDGYAICGDDAYDGAELNVIGQAPAGKAFNGVVSKGMAVRIFTGAAVPKPLCGLGTKTRTHMMAIT